MWLLSSWNDLVSLTIFVLDSNVTDDPFSLSFCLLTKDHYSFSLWYIVRDRNWDFMRYHSEYVEVFWSCSIIFKKINVSAVYLKKKLNTCSVKNVHTLTLRERKSMCVWERALFFKYFKSVKIISCTAYFHFWNSVSSLVICLCKFKTVFFFSP